MLSPLSHYPKIKQAHIHESGMVDGYRYEVLCNGRSGEQKIPFSFVLFQGIKKQKVMMIQEEGGGLLSQVFLRCYTAIGTQIDLCPDSLDEKIQFSLALAKQYIQKPKSFEREIAPPEETLFPPLDYFPLLRSSQLIETSSIGAYRYELHTQCSSLQRIQYHHVLFCFAPFQEKPCFVVSAESFGELGPSLGVFHNKGHSNLGLKPNLLDINFFRDEAFSLVHKELLKKETEEEAFPNIRKAQLIEKGLIGHFRCALYVDIPPQKSTVFFHAFALFRGEIQHPEFLFVLEKNKHDPKPKLILYRHETKSDLGSEDSLLDVKLFRDRVVVFLKLILREEVFHNTDIHPFFARLLLRIQRFFELTFMSVLFSFVMIVWGSLASGKDMMDGSSLELLLSGVHGMTLVFAAITFRYAKTSVLYTLFYLLFLALPLYSLLLLPVSLFSFGALYRVVAQTYYRANLDYNWIGLSHSARAFLHNIVQVHR